MIFSIYNNLINFKTMKKIVMTLMAIFVVMAISCKTKDGGIQDAQNTAIKFLELYNVGDSGAAEYVNFDGIYLMELALTAERARTEEFPKELSANKGKAKPTVTVVSERVVSGDEIGSPNRTLSYVTCQIDDKTETLLLYEVDGVWKVDITDKWANDWFDGMIY